MRSELAESETGIAGHLLSPLAAEERAQLTELLRRVLAGLDRQRMHSSRFLETISTACPVDI